MPWLIQLLQLSRLFQLVLLWLQLSELELKVELLVKALKI